MTYLYRGVVGKRLFLWRISFEDGLISQMTLEEEE
jgi:hypothetical protein